ncbi:MAG: DUF502 domain-containing protein [Hyphomonadaceae bacterium]
MSDTAPQKPFHPLEWLRNSFLAGVALVLPFVVTGWLIWTFVTFIDTNVAPLMPPVWAPVADNIPGFGVVVAVAALTLIGALTGNLVGRFLLNTTERIVTRLPIVRSIYGGSKQIFKQVAAPERTSFKEAVMVEFPRPGCWAIGFVTNEEAGEITAELGDDLVAVYVPQAPIPTSGFLIYFPRTALKPITLGPEEALKRVISLGIVKSDETFENGETNRS